MLPDQLKEFLSNADVSPLFALNLPPSTYTPHSRYIYDPKFWLDKGRYWLNTAEQGTDTWKSHRKDRLTASNIGYALGMSPFSTPLDIALDITGWCPKEFSEKSIAIMAQGNRLEPEAREWYMRQQNVQVDEVGLAVPKDEPRIGASLDGDVIGTEGMIEIKCPQKMYYPLVKYMEQRAQGWNPPIYYHDHIWKTHYIQMHACMYITGKKWCDYVVYVPKEDKVFMERVHFCHGYWQGVIEPGIKKFLKEYLEPLIQLRESKM